MFRIIITLVYLLPIIYVFFRLKHHFIPYGYRKIYSLIFVILALFYPLTNFFFRNIFEKLFPDPMLILGAYTAVLFLYILLLILLFDIFLLLNRFLHLVSRPVIKKSRQQVKGLLIIVSLAIAIVIGGIINFNTIRTTNYQIEIPKRSSRTDHIKIAFIADFHIDEKTNGRYVERVIEKINTIQPDLMLFGGDIVEGDGYTEILDEFAKRLNQIKSEYRMYGVIGNHEIYAGDHTDQFYRKAGIRLLKDTVEVINNSINLIGRYDQHINDRQSLKELLSCCRDTLPVIMLDHRPTEIPQVSETCVDMQLSGHTHNGQLFPFNLITKSIYPISRGYEKIKNTHFFVTSGIRLWGPRVRTTGISEIMVIDVKFR